MANETNVLEVIAELFNVLIGILIGILHLQVSLLYFYNNIY